MPKKGVFLDVSLVSIVSKVFSIIMVPIFEAIAS